MTEQAKVENKEHESSGDEGHDDEHDHDHANCKEEGHDHGHEGDLKSNRGQKKFKKAMSKMGLKPVTGINRVTIKKGKQFIISIDDPDVWKTPGNQNSYIVFGKPNMDGLQTGQNEINQFKSPVEVEEEKKPAAESAVADPEAPQETTIEELPADGIKEDSIRMVMQYTKCSKAEAIKALRETGDDSVTAIMKLAK